ncbi:MAG: hypothetical protein EBV31_07705 [Verrucomicrobia bacterium]|nr:hypothetical protein [Verrucomicrobiota bacterium]
MRYPCAILLLCLGLTGCQQYQARPEIVPAEYVGLQAPKTTTLLLQKDDRLAICGDSITEQKMYSRIMEAYIVAARSDLHVTVRQYGWSGEQAGGFLKRMDNDVLRFKPTIATTCYGMNDFRYVPQDDAIAATYRQNQTAVVRKFKEAGARVVLGSSGTIHSVPPWVKSAKGTWQTLNLALLNFRNIDIEVAQAEQVAFADVYWPMLVKGHEARAKYGEGFKLGVNLAAEFPQNPTSPAFAKIWQAVGDKQAYETKQIKTLFRSPEAKKDMEAVVKSSQVEFDRLAAALKAVIKPVDSTIKVEEVR